MERTRRIPIVRGPTRARPPLHVVRRPRSGAVPTAEPRVSLESVGASWWSALDAAETALRAAGSPLKPEELRQRAGRLTAERAATVELLDEVARAERVRARFSQLLLSRSNLRVLLGLPSGVRACVFNLDGVLVGSAALHSAAWAETFDELILAR